MRILLSIVAIPAILLLSVVVHAQDKVVVVPLGGKKPVGDAVSADVLDGKIFSNKDEVGVTGTMMNNGAVTITPSNEAQSIPEGYHNGSGTVPTDANLATGNIRSGATIFGVAGKTEVVDTTSGDALPEHLLKHKKAWVDGIERTGTTGLFWGCRPGRAAWTEADCSLDCEWQFPGIPGVCDTFCSDLDNVTNMSDTRNFSIIICNGARGI